MNFLSHLSPAFAFAHIPELKIFSRPPWHWQMADPEMLHPWESRLAGPELDYIKNLPHRKVFRTSDFQGRELFVKHSLCLSCFDRCKFFFVHPLYQEFLILRKLHQEGIPCIKAEGYGCTPDQEILITRSLDNCITALEFWHTIAVESPDLQKQFLEKLTRLLSLLKHRKYIHRDFHPENLLYQKDSGEIFIVDPYKLRPCPSRCSALQDILFCDGLLFMSGRLSDPELIQLLVNSGLSADPDKGALLLQRTRCRKRKIYLHKYPKRIRKILAGTSQYTRTEKTSRGILHIRNTPWNTPQEFHPEQLSGEERETGQARQIWTDSILPLQEDCTPDRKPAAWLQIDSPAEKDILYYPKTPSGITSKEMES